METDTTTFIATAAFNYHGYKPLHPSGVQIAKVGNRYEVHRYGWLEGIGYRYAVMARSATEAAAREIANKEWTYQSNLLKAEAAENRTRNMAVIAAFGKAA